MRIPQPPVILLLAAAPLFAQFGPATPAQIEAIKKAAAVPTPKTVDGHPDLNGYWGFNALAAAANVLGTQKITLDGKVPVAAPESLEHKFNIAGVEKRKADAAARPVYKPEFAGKAAENFERAAYLDPSYKCMPLGVPRVGPPDEIVQTPQAMYFLYNSRNIYRVIPTDGRPHDPAAEPMAMGDSIGRWDGDTFVIDATNFTDDTWLDGDGSFHTAAMHVVERLTRKGNTIDYEVTVDDPAVMAKPFAGRPRTLMLGHAGQHATEDYPCREMDQEHLTTNERH
jgi:hypothetical protein